jgi:lipoic acid synthetase
MISRLPAWLKQDFPGAGILNRVRDLSGRQIHTVCQEAHCPNVSDCLKRNEFTFIILGDTCTRNCRFCSVKKSGAANLGVDSGEPLRVAQAVKEFGIDYALITSVARDDLADGGAEIFFRTIGSIRRLNRNTKVEVLIPDFQGNIASLKRLLEAAPDVVGHNLETVRRLYPILRPQADYRVSLKVLKKIKEINPALITKSSLMLGLGETETEALEAMRDLRLSGADILTLGQYLAPSAKHHPVAEFILPWQFKKYEEAGLNMGFKAVSSGPRVRSSYRAKEIFLEACYA